MKSLILSFLLIFGLAAPNISKPINDIYSIKEPSVTEEAYVNDNPCDTRAIAVKYMLNMKMKTSDEANINDLLFDTEKIFYEKLAAQLTEQYRNETDPNALPEALENDFCCFEIRVPRSVSALINTTVKESVRQ